MIKRFLKFITGKADGPKRTTTAPNDPNKDIEGRIYTAFSPYLNHKEAKLLGMTADRATVVAKKVGDKFVYGISICSENDAFSRKKGRELAIERLNKNFGQADCSNIPVEGENWERAIIRFANNVAVSILEDPNRFKRKICNNCNPKGDS